MQNLRVIGYEPAMHLQDRLVSARLNGDIPDTLLLLQHPPVLTIGTSGGEEYITTAKATLIQEGIAVTRTDRGGNITYHGYGQLVGYPILDLSSRGKDIHRYVRSLEEVIIRTLGDFSIPAYRDPMYPGVWAEEGKICSLGIRVRHWITKHGFALNVNNDLRHFSYIHPCGIVGRKATSMSQLLQCPVSIEEMIPSLLHHFARVFQVNIQY